MLVFAVDYQEAINEITGDRAMSLRQYELSGEEWSVAEQLRDILKVRCTVVLTLYNILMLNH